MEADYTKRVNCVCSTTRLLQRALEGTAVPAATVRSAVHRGSYNTIGDAREAILRWIEANGYRIVGPDREIYLYNTMPVRLDDPSYVTELQYPVGKVVDRY